MSGLDNDLMNFLIGSGVGSQSMVPDESSSSSFFWSGLHDHIACSLLGGGIPTQNSGYRDTRICPS